MVQINQHALRVLNAAAIVKPGATNTGPNSTAYKTQMGLAQGSGTDVALTPIASQVIDDAWINANGNVLENFETNAIFIQNITQPFTLRNFRLLSDISVNYQLYVRGSMMANVQVEHGELNGGGNGIYCIPDWNSSMGHGYEFENGFRATFEHLNIHEQGGDACKIESRANLRRSWIHHIGRNPGSHADGIQVQSGNSSQQGAPAGHMAVEWNFFDMPLPDGPNGPGDPYASNAAMIIQQTAGHLDIKVENNWMNGGNYTVYWNNLCTDCTFKNNRFGPDYRFGLVSLGGSYVNFDRSGNVYDVTADYPTVFAGSGGTQSSNPQTADTAIPGG